jgi:hypothetical protein
VFEYELQVLNETEARICVTGYDHERFCRFRVMLEHVNGSVVKKIDVIRKLYAKFYDLLDLRFWQ